MPFFRSTERQEAALKEWQLYRTGDCADIASSVILGFFKSEPVLSSQEFADLPREEQDRLRQPTIPSYEIGFNPIGPECYLAPDTTPPILNILVIVMNSQGRGSVQLSSEDPASPLDFHPAFLTHPYDQRVAIEATREVLRVARSDIFTEDGASEKPEWDVPQTAGEEDILNWWRQRCGTTWHMSGTCKMSREEGETAVVDTEFRVFGVRGLRVADMSVMPIMVR